MYKCRKETINKIGAKHFFIKASKIDKNRRVPQNLRVRFSLRLELLKKYKAGG
jgi:hypothetical protein